MIDVSDQVSELGIYHMSSFSESKLQIIKQLEVLAQTKMSPEQAEKFLPFLPIYFSQMPLIDLSERSLNDLYCIAYSHWELMQVREPGELKIKVFNPDLQEHGWCSSHTIIQVITDDMPFLVDSMRMEINRLNYTTYLMIHCGGMKVRRTEQGEILNVYPYHSREAEGSINEAPIEMEIDCQTNPDVLANIKKNLIRVLNDVRLAVNDWQAMCEKMQECIDELGQQRFLQGSADVLESKAFLEWLLKNHFTFLGFRDYVVEGKGAEQGLRLVSGSGLGVLRDESRSKIFRLYSELPERAREMALSKDQILIISKTNTLSTVHRPAYTDYIGIKCFNEQGDLVRERRFIGLYTSEAYRMDPRSIPFIRHKVSSILKMSKLPPQSHAGKDLLHIISLLPRDDLFHANTEELFDIGMGILQMQERRCTRLFIRKDAYDRFISCLVYLPKDNLSSAHVQQIETLLKEVFDPIDISQSTYVSESQLARIHYVVRIDPKKTLQYDPLALEKEIVRITRSFDDDLRHELLTNFGEEQGKELIQKYRHAFPAGYREVFEARSAVLDIENIERLGGNSERLGMSFYRPFGADKSTIRFKLYRVGMTVPLSDAVPMLENLGLRVIGEQPYRLVFPDGQDVWINDFGMTFGQDRVVEVEQHRQNFQDAFQAIWLGDAEDDPFNQLILAAQLSWREVTVLRAYTKYSRQIGVIFSTEFIASVLVNHPEITQLLVKLFKQRFDPSQTADTDAQKITAQEIELQLEKVVGLNEDRSLRRFVALIQATCRTNYFQHDAAGQFKPYLALKMDSAKVPNLPLPVPQYETFIYATRFEGIHLRSSKVARGGIRWSDRHEDFRTEILGLMKAQQVKNSLIVPSGAKGGFVVKCPPPSAKRDEVMQEGIACYQDFIRGLLDVVDNIQEGNPVTHPNTVRYDDFDPYLVVAADKGTATFSDIANQISEDRHHWLGDAFASGGSTGYDHKKMGITARGAWVSARRHFQNLGINVDEAPITLVGIGDMSGDVFGNGLLLSSHCKLVAAFNHAHIFLDPNPNPEESFAERQRLFNLPRSTWEDYQTQLISSGGGVYSRGLKSIKLTPEVRELLKVDQEALEPTELIKAILKAPVDMIWNGGIGTYIKSSAQSNESVGDRSNDVLRVDGQDVRARVICEGGNLGLTQLGRIEYELKGGIVNTDFIDNSAGVDCSDHEVNIKILLNGVVSNGDMTVKQRNQLLASMTDEVAELVLEDNYQQNRVIAMSSFYSLMMMPLFIRYIQLQEKAKKLNRALEFLPNDEHLMDRRSQSKGLTRPEISVLLSYSKMILKAELLKTSLVEDAYFCLFLKKEFPKVLHDDYYTVMKTHYLSKEIIATQVANQLVADMGITFITQMQDEMSASIEQIVRAYAAARAIFQLEEYNLAVEALDYQVPAQCQYDMMYQGVRVVRRAVRWFLRNRRDQINVEQTVKQFSCDVQQILARLPKLMLGHSKERLEADLTGYVKLGVPEDLARRAASMSRLYHALNVIEAAHEQNIEVFRVAKIYFMVVDRLDLLWFRDQINEFPVSTHWSVLAKASYKGDLDWVQRALTASVLRCQSRSIPGKINEWFAAHQSAITRWNTIIADMRAGSSVEFAVLFVALKELMDLALASI
jgi:glutamate dehydrogenase